MPGAKWKPETRRRWFDSSYIMEPNSGCLLWVRTLDGGGYGYTRHLGKKIPAHRLAWILGRGAVPRGMCVLHKCDTPACVRIDHLFLGTQRDNIDDKVAKNRQQKGERVPLAKLTAIQACAIFFDKRAGRIIAKQYGVSRTTVSNIRTGLTWFHATGARRSNG